MMYASPQTTRPARACRGAHGAKAARFALRPLAMALAAGSLLSLPALMGQGQAHAQAAAVALPSGPTVVQGQAQVVTHGNRMTVTNTNGSILNWQSFSIGNGAGVHFVQPSATSQVLNRVTGNDPSSILGSLSSNGRVWLLNPNGVLFGQNARVDVAGLVASTLNISNSDWSAGRYSLSAPGSGAPAGVVNQGELRSSLGGHIALIGGSVRNEGLIESVGGQVLLAAGRSIELVDTGAPNLAVRVTAPEGEALNLGTLAAAGGRIDVHAAVVNQQGVVRADSLGTNARGEIVLGASQALNLAAGSLTSASGEAGGKIVLDSGRTGTTLVDGQVLATGSSGLGGDVKLLGHNVGLQGSALVDASGRSGGGQVLVGGGERGQDSTVPNASAVYVGQDARISADATGQGNGGRVILWSDKATRAYGTFTATGGAQGGNGGFIETSGGWIDVRPTQINATAAKGVAGTWLLDPWNLLITGPVDTLGVSPFPFTTFTDAVATGAQIAASDIVNALNAGNSVTISTGTTGTEAGDITVRNANLVATSATAVGLTLQAARDIVVTGSSFGSSNATPVSLSLQAGTSGTGQGRVEVNGGTTINTSGGDVTMTGSGYAFDGSPANSGYAVYLTNTTINAGAGKVTLVGTSNTPFNAARGVSVAGGSITAGSIDINGTASTTATNNAAAGAELNFTSLNAGTISITGNSAGSATPFTVGTVVSGSTVTATDSLTISGTSSGTGVLADSGAVMQVTPAAINPGAQLTITGTSNRTVLPDSSYSSYGVNMAGGSYGATLRATNGAGISVTGSNQNLQPALNLTGGVVIDAATGGNVTLRGDSPASGNATAVVDVNLSAGGAVQVRANDVTVGGSFTSTATGDALVVAGATTANTTFFANSGATFSTPNGRWLVYGQDPGNVISSGLAHNFRQYNATFGVANALTPATGNGILYSLAPTITLSGANLSKTYDGSTTSGPLLPSGVSFTGVQSGDVASLSSGATGTYADKDAGLNKVVNVGGAAVTVVDSTGLPVLGYGLISTLRGDILRKSISLGTATASNKVYDGTQVASVSLSGLTGLVGSETLGTTVTGTFNTKDVGTAKPVNVSVSLSNGSNGGLATNYVLTSSTTSASADITAKGVSFGTVTASNKVYDGSTLASITLGPLTGLVGTETLNVTANGTFANKDVGTGKLVTVSGVLADGSNGGVASNYALLPASTTTNADITPRPVSLTGATATSKLYDGSTVASVNVAGVSGLVGTETLTVNSSGNFVTPDAGTGKVVAITASVANGSNGGLASNYALSSPSTSALANINRAPLTITANNASKVFGTTLTFAGTEFTTSPLVGGQTVGSVTLASAGAAASASVAGGPYSIIPSAATGGSFNPANYQISYVNGVLTVTPAALGAVLASIVGNPSKVYDGSTVATLAPTNYTLTGFVGSDSATVNQTVGQYDSANAGARTVTATLANGNFVPVGSTDLRNYTLPTSASGSGTITPRPLTVIGIAANNKVYDGNVLATLSNSGSLIGLVGTQTLGLVSTSASFNTADAGTGKTVTVTGLTLSNGSNGGLAANYVLGTNSATTTADISRAPLTITANSTTKVFGSTVTFTGTEFTTSPLVAGELVGSVSLASAGAAASASVAGGPYSIIPSAATGGSFNPANYQISYVNGLLAVNPADLRVVLVNIVGNSTKVYDGTDVAALTPANYSLSGFIGSDSAAINQALGRYDSANVGNRTVTATLAPGNFTPSGGTDLRNYTLPTSVSGSGSITPRQLGLVGLTASNKAYDGTTLATVASLGSLNGLVGGQTLGLVSTGANFDNKDAGDGKTVTVTGLTLANGSNGGLASNYVLAGSATTTANITPRQLTVTGITAANKVYDGNNLASVSIGALSGLVGSETLGSSASGRFDNQNVGQDKPVTVTVGLSNGSNGGLASNYRVGSGTSTQASITPATLTYTANPADKLVGAPLPLLTGSVSGFVAGETQATATTGSLGFVTPALAESPAGQYAVNGSGLAARNYVFSQAPGNATALTVRGLPAQAIDNSSRTALGQSLVAVTLKSVFSSSTDGRVLDVMPALLGSRLGQGSMFTSVSLGSMSMDQLASLLAARDRYKKNLFAGAIHQLEEDPTLADVRPCQSVKEVDTGTCLITEELKRQIIAERESLQAAAAPAGQPGSPSPGQPASASPAPAPAADPAAAPAPAPAPAPVPVAPATQLAAAPRAAPPPLFHRRVRTAALPQIERKIAVVIGINRYTDPTIPQLDNAVGDARAIGKLLESTLGYETLVLENASKQSIVRTFNRLATELAPRDSVVIYYAGHGELIEASKLGYWQLADSDAKKPETWLSNADITRLVGQISASQVALISDSCYSGSLVDERIRGGITATDPSVLLEGRTVVVMSSGGNEPVFDAGRDGHSPFAYNLMDNLSKVSNWQAGGNVFERVRFAVARELPQRPRYGTTSSAGHQARWRLSV